MDKSDLLIQKANLGMYWDMIKGALSNKGVLFILLCFIVVVVLAFTFGYMQGVNSVPECVRCVLY